MTQELFYPSFRRWVGQQGGSYQWSNATACPMAIWAGPGWLGGLSKVLSPGHDIANKAIVVPENGAILQDCLRSSPMTYEALTKRLDAAFTKTGLRRRPKPRAPYEPTGPLGSFKRGAVA